MGRMMKGFILSVSVILLLVILIEAVVNKPAVTPGNQYDIVEMLDGSQTREAVTKKDETPSETAAHTEAIDHTENIEPAKTIDQTTDQTTDQITDQITDQTTDQAIDLTINKNIDQIENKNIDPELLYSKNAILVRLEDQTVLLEKNAETKIYPASLTKIMTVIVALENIPDLAEEIELSDTMFQRLYEAGASMAGFQPEEEVRAVDLLYGALLPSGAESCVGLAERIAGSEQEFADMMNQKAAELGMENTRFENVTGLHDENHFTTVKDMSILLSYALQNNTFREIFTSSSYSTQSTNLHPEGITFYSTMFEKLKRYNHSNEDVRILGGKTGYTDEAGLCLASLALVGDQEYILITAGAKGNHDTEQYNVTDALAVYNRVKQYR